MKAARLLSSFLLSASLFAAHVSAYADRYFIQQDQAGSVQEADGDLSQISAKEWHVRLYRNGASTVGPSHWGLLKDRTAAGVMKKLKDSQDFQVRWAKWAGIDYRSEVSTYFNPLGPIAILRKPKPMTASAFATANRLFDIYDRLNAARRKIDEILAKEPKQPNPYSEVGKVLKEYAESLLATERRVHELEAKMSSTFGSSEGELLAALDGFERDLGRESERQARYESSAGAANPAADGNTSWMLRSYEVKDFGGHVGCCHFEKRIALIDGKLILTEKTKGAVYAGAQSTDVAWFNVSVTTSTFDLKKLETGAKDLQPYQPDDDWCVRLSPKRGIQTSEVVQTEGEEFYEKPDGTKRPRRGGIVIAPGSICFSDVNSAQAAANAIRASAAK